MKSQISLEFMVGVVILLIIYVAAISFFSNYTRTELVGNELAKQICYKISTSMDSTIIGGTNFTINVTLPEKLENDEYYYNILEKTDNSIIISIAWDANQSLTTCTSHFFPIEDNISLINCKRFSIENTGKNLIFNCI